MPLDIGVGILLSLGVAQWFGMEATPFFILLGIAFALLPDIDILPWFWRTAYDHRSYPHYPIVHVPIALLIFASFGSMYAVLYALCILAHLIHDTIGLGWGITWAWPFSPRKFLFLPAARTRTHGWFMSWTPEEETRLGRDDHVPNWLTYYYFRPNPVAFVEYGALFFALLILFWHLLH